jgi:XrtJ-associated TM-motif-TM protein
MSPFRQLQDTLNLNSKEKDMKQFSFFALLVVTLFVAATPLHAQGGCVNSPENPTAILGLAGSAGAGLAYLRVRMKARKK